MIRNATVPPETLQKFVDKGRLYAPGEGPDAATRAASNFVLNVVDADTDAVLASVSGGDPGYDETAKMVSEAALALVDRSDVVRDGGVHTPAAAFGAPLVDRLRAAGMRLAC